MRVRRALRAGWGALLACLLSTALFAAPAAAAQHDFGHSHPEGAAPHLHAVAAVLVGLAAHALTRPAPPQRAGAAPRLLRPPRPAARAPGSHRSRAPPL